MRVKALKSNWGAAVESPPQASPVAESISNLNNRFHTHPAATTVSFSFVLLLREDITTVINVLEHCLCTIWCCLGTRPAAIGEKRRRELQLYEPYDLCLPYALGTKW